MFVTVKLIGRLGNQLFQYGAAIGYSEKYNVDYYIPMSTQNNKVWKPYRLGSVNYIQALPLPMKVIRENGHYYSEIPFLDSEAVLLDGYFQSYKYFQHCIDKFRDLLGFDYSPIKDTCAIHVRRGDYVQLSKHHPPCTREYYQNAIYTMIKNGITNFVVFSDDIDYCKNELFQNRTGFKYGDGKDELWDFNFMLRCEHQIIANSSFSLMAAILNKNPNKIIVSPHEDNWFGKSNAHLDPRDMIPNNFIKIKYA